MPGDDPGGASAEPPEADDRADLIEGLLAGEHRALARVITKIENRAPGYRELVSRLHAHTGDAEIIGVTGSPGSGKSTLVDKMATRYRDRGLTVGVIAIDPSSPFTGGAVLGDRIRMASNVGDMDVFFRSMSARGTLGGLATATTDAVRALDAFGKDRIIVETVGAGQNEVDIVKTADTVAVLVPPSTGDDVQMLKAGILEIGDVFVVNKADMDGAARTVKELREMVHMREASPAAGRFDEGGHHGGGLGRDAGENGGSGADGEDAEPGDEHGERGADAGDSGDDGEWVPPVIETVATSGEGVDEFLEVLADHRTHLEESGRLERKLRTRHAEEVRSLLREDTASLVEEELEDRGGIDGVVERIVARETDPYSVANDLLEPLEDCVRERRERE